MIEGFTYHFQSTLRIEVARSEEDQQEIIVVSVMKIRGRVQKFAQLNNRLLPDLWSFPELLLRQRLHLIVQRSGI